MSSQVTARGGYRWLSRPGWRGRGRRLFLALAAGGADSLAAAPRPAPAAGGYTITATIRVGGFPHGVAVSPDEIRAYVANYSSGSVSVIDTGNRPRHRHHRRRQLPERGGGQPGRQPHLRHQLHGPGQRVGDHPPVSGAGAWPTRYCSRRARILRLK